MDIRVARRSIVSVALLSALVAVGCKKNNPDAPAGGPRAANGPGAPGAMRDPSRFLMRFDRNGNGSVELTELPDGMRERMSAADTNHDGTISADEMAAHAAARRQARFARMDTNSDGAITTDEVGPERWARISRADANSDGRVTREEMDQAQASGLLRGGPGWGPGGPGAPGTDNNAESDENRQ
jgi:hypothetical protein